MQVNKSEATLCLKIAENVMKEAEPPELLYKKLTWILLGLRARALTNGLRLMIGDCVYDGPFKGMRLTEGALLATHTPVLLGCYEQELHAVIEETVSSGYEQIINIGCSVGYYAVGLARRMPNVSVDAFDIDDVSRNICHKVVQANGVDDRVHISGEFFGENFENYSAKKTLVFMDIEGGEKALLDPQRFPALQKMDVIVELHDLMDPSISKLLCSRFEPTHTISVIKNRFSLPNIEKIMPENYYLDPYDHFLMAWEGRDGRTPWGVFRAKG